MDHRHVRGGPRGLDDRKCGTRADGRARPGAFGARPLGGAATAGAVVDVADELAAQGGGEQDAVVAEEPGDGGTVAGLDDGEGGPGAFHLAGRGGQELTGGRGVEAEDGGDGARGEAVAYGQFERFALFGRGAGGLGPGELCEFAAVRFGCRGGLGGVRSVCGEGGGVGRQTGL